MITCNVVSYNNKISHMNKRHMTPELDVITLFSCSVNSLEHEICPGHNFLKMSILVGILKLITRINDIVYCSEQENCLPCI